MHIRSRVFPWRKIINQRAMEIVDPIRAVGYLFKTFAIFFTCLLELYIMSREFKLYRSAPLAHHLTPKSYILTPLEGMGVYSPLPKSIVSDALLTKIHETILQPTIDVGLRNSLPPFWGLKMGSAT